MTDNADITQLQTTNHHRLLSHVYLGIVECRKLTACAQIAEHFKPNTVLWAFHTEYSHLVNVCIVSVQTWIAFYTVSDLTWLWSCVCIIVGLWCIIAVS